MNDLPQPRDENGRYLEPKVVESEGGEKIEFCISEYECRVVGNRLNRAMKNYEHMDENFDQDCSYWAARFLSEVADRDSYDDDFYNQGEKRHTEINYSVVVSLTDYECWSLGNRLFQVGNFFREEGYERVGDETQFLARRFHAERDS